MKLNKKAFRYLAKFEPISEIWKRVKTFLKKHEFNYVILPDAGQVHKDYRVTSCPTSIVIDKQGIIRFITQE